MAYWSRKNVLEFIKIYKDKEILWDPDNNSHFNKALKNDAWNEIAAEFSRRVSGEVSVNECKKKLESLLAAYRRERLKIRKSHGTGSGTGDVHQSNWFAFDGFEFLMNRDFPREARCSMPKEENCQNDSNQSSSNVTQNIPENPGPSSLKASSSKKRKNQHEDRSEEASEKEEAPKTVNHDECQAFGMYVGYKLLSYSRQVRNIVQHEISNILFNTDCEYYNLRPMNNSNNPTTSAHLPTPPITPPSTRTQVSMPAPSPVNTNTSEESDLTN